MAHKIDNLLYKLLSITYTMKQPSQKIIFKIGEESFPTILAKEEQMHSPFYNTIQSAVECIEELASKANVPNNNASKNWEYETRNNIVSFFGDRGTGKTSCMRSTINNCKNDHPDWLFIDEIDPSFFDETHNIVDILIGVIYGIFKNEIREWENKHREQQEKLRILQNMFCKIKSALSYIEKGLNTDDESEIDELLHLNDGSKLRALIKELVDTLLDYSNKKFMLISIDDLDLNIAYSYIMMERIRKFLIIPNVAIMIAAKYNQLFDSVCLVLASHYKNIPDRVSHKDISEMAERYLNKIFPLGQRFSMPSIDSYMDSELILKDKNNNVVGTQGEGPVALRVPALIFEKTRYLFYNSSGMPSRVIPRNLRDLRMLVSMLFNMKPFEEDGRKNQRRFRDYFFEEWIGSIINPEYRPFAKALISEENIAKVNRFVINHLYTFFLKDIIPYDKLNESSVSDDYISREHILLREILNPRNSYWNVSVGDVVIILNYVKKVHDSSSILSLLFFIETFYSMKLYELYNEMTDMTDISGLKVAEEKPSTSPELKATVHGDIMGYFRLIGGSFFSANGISFIPSVQSEKDGRERRLVNGRLLLKEITRIVSDYKKIESFKDSKVSKDKEIPSELSARLRLCEFFMLTIRQRDDLKVSYDTLRLSNEPLYFHPFGNTAKNLVFDVTAPFFNTIYPKLSYDRFNKDIYDIALKDEESLLKRMIKFCSRGKKNDTWELMSKASIRNMEILEDLTQWMTDNREKIRPAGNDLKGSYQDFYRRYEVVERKGEIPTSGYFVKTYNKIKDFASDQDKTDGTPYYLIDYSVYSLLGSVLKELDAKDISDKEKKYASERNAIFEGIISYDDLFILKDEYLIDDVKDTLYQYCKRKDVDSAMGTIKSDIITINELIDILADLRIKFLYDFDKCLPKQMQQRYSDLFNTKMDIWRKKIEEKESELRVRLRDIISKKDLISTEIKSLKSRFSIIQEKQIGLTEKLNKVGSINS